MTTYAIGDIQGCFHAFSAMLAKLKFNPKVDTLWLVGDIVNRGTGSLEMLRWCFAHQDCIKLVLGNHDLHCLVVAHGFKPAHRGDTLDAILNAPDKDQLLDWLRHQPLMHVEDNVAMLHAGVLPQWTITQAQGYAREIEAVLQAADFKTFLAQMYGNTPAVWNDNLTGIDRLRCITNAFTRLRICKQDGEMEFNFKGELANIPVDYLPWFAVPNRKSTDTTIICGHWSALGLYQANNIIALDTGCLWGGDLTVLKVQNLQMNQRAEFIQVKSQPADLPNQV